MADSQKWVKKRAKLHFRQKRTLFFESVFYKPLEMLFSFILALKNSPTKYLSMYLKSFDARIFILEMAEAPTGSVLALFRKVTKKRRFGHFLEKKVRVL